MASWTAVSALPWHHSTLDVDPRDGLATGATVVCLCVGAAGALAFRYRGSMNRTYLSSTFDGDSPRLVGRALACLLVALEHALGGRGVLCAVWNSGEDGADVRGASGMASEARRATELSASCCAVVLKQPPAEEA